MNIDLVAKKLVDVVDVIRAEKGPLELFGLFLRENSPDDIWDVVVASHGLKAGDRDSYQFVGDRLRKVLTDNEMLGLAQIVLLQHGDAVLNDFLEIFKDRTGLVDVHHETEGGAVIRRAYILVAEKVPDQRPRRKAKKQPQPK